MYKQIIIARKDLNMSYGKLSAQVSHGSMAFLISMIKEKAKIINMFNDKNNYECHLTFDVNTFEDWINGEFTKCVLKAKNKNQLLKAKTIAEEIGLQEGKDFWLIKDNCHTELEPEEDGTTLTVIGFRPLDAEIADKIGKRFQLYS